MVNLLTSEEIVELVAEYGDRVNEGRPIRKIIEDGDLPRLEGVTVKEGKVSDSVFGGNLETLDGTPVRLMYRTNRISTHDVSRGAIPFKDQVLGVNHDAMLQLVRPVLGTAQLDIPKLEPTSTVIAAENLDLIQFENVLRMYMAKSSTETSLFHHYVDLDEREFCGHKLPEGLTANCRLPYLMDTPSTKGKVDMSIAPAYLFENGICTPEQYAEIRNSSMMAFGIVTQHAKSNDLVLVDTKTEHGRNHKGEIVSCDELYTLDSSRWWKIDSDGNLLLNKKGSPVSYSKEFAREMIKDKETQTYTSFEAKEIAARYIKGVQCLTGQRFEPDTRPRDERIIESTELILDALGV